MNVRLLISLFAAAALAMLVAPAAFAAERARVAIELRPAATTTASASAANGRLSARELELIRNPRLGVLARQRLTSAQEAKRRRALRRVAPQVAANARALRSFGRRLERIGGRVTTLRPLNRSLEATLPARRVATVRRWRGVVSVTPAAAVRPLAVPTGVQAIGASAAWAQGFTGGTGPADLLRGQRDEPNPSTGGQPAYGLDAPDLGISGDPIQRDHPTFQGLTIDYMDGAPASVTSTHGTPVAAAAAGQGVATCPAAPGYACNAADVDPDRKGSAPGVDKLLDVHNESNDAVLERYSGDAWALGFSQTGYDTGAVLAGAADPMEVENASNGSIPVDNNNELVDDESSDRYRDGLVDDFGVSYFQGAGNDGGVAPRRLICRAYNLICVGGTADNSTATTADDTIASYSSRGPSPAGRKKPDLVAPGNIVGADRNWKETSSLWTSMEGTSFASPLAAGAGLILRGASGITDPAAIKAILLNSARQGRATPASAMGTQSGWQPDWGWGMVDTTAALAQRTNFDTATLSSDDAAFYAATAQAAGDRATLVWNRHVSPCFTVYCGGQGQGAQPLTDLNLHQHPVAPAGQCATGAQVSSTSSIDNVEQVRAAAAGNVIYRVTAATDESYAIAGTRQLRRLASPRPQVSIALEGPETVANGSQPLVHVTIKNPSDEMTACVTKTPTVTVTGALGVVNGGDNTLPSTLAPGASYTWTVRVSPTSPEGGQATIAVAATDEAYGTTLTGRASKSVTVAAAPKPEDPVVVEPDPPTTQPLPPVPPAQPPAPPVTPPSVTTPPPSVFPPPTMTPTRRSAALKVTTPKVAKDRRTVTIGGTVARAVTGKITVSIRVKIGRKTRTFKKTVTIRRGKFTAKIKLSSRSWKTAKATVKYAGNSRYAARTVSRSFKQRR